MKTFICAIVVALGLAAVAVFRQPTQAVLAEPAEQKAVAAPEFTKGTEWLQSKPLKLADLRGQVVVVHFWTNGCINCIHNYPHYKSWQEKFAGKGATIIGIHTPEFSSEADINRIKAKAEENGLKFPIAVDNDSSNWKAWKNQYWPAVYLIDKKGVVRQRWEGELGTDGEKSVRQKIEELIAEK